MKCNVFVLNSWKFICGVSILLVFTSIYAYARVLQNKRMLSVWYLYPKHVIARFPSRRAIIIPSISLFTLRSILYSPDVIFFFSRSLPFAISPPLYALWSSRLFFLSLWTGRRDAEARWHSHSRYFTVSCSGTLGCLFSLFFFLFFSFPWVSTPHIFRKIDNKICTCEIHLLLTFTPLLFVPVKSSRRHMIVEITRFH